MTRTTANRILRRYSRDFASTRQAGSRFDRLSAQIPTFREAVRTLGKSEAFTVFALGSK